MLNLKEKVMNKQEVKKFKGRCVIHPGLFVGATNFDTILDEATASETMGYGVFTDQDIPAGTILEECISAKERIPIDDDQGILFGFNTQSVAEINNKMVDDVKVILAEYRRALKKYNRP